jgi:ribulose-phosphate 3-epimerase
MVKALRPLTLLPLDVHLMVENPSFWIEPFVQAGADIITVHAEADRHLQRTLAKIREYGALAGAVLNPASPLCLVEHVLCDCDLVLLMSVNPGFGGQSFLPQLPEKIAALRKLADKYNSKLEIEVDGGINVETAKLCIEAGATILVAGNAVFTAENPTEMVKALRGRNS